MDSVFGPIFDVIGQVLAFLYDIVPNLGVDIILLTCLIMLLLYPLTAKQAKSMMAMQRVQPEVKRLQQKYKGDRQKLNEEMMAFYKENKINPLAGCLPLLVQLPIFISLFNVLREPEKYVPKDSSLFHSLCDGAQCAKGKVNAQYFLGLNLELSATDVNGFFNALPYFILVGLVGLTGYLSVRQAQKRTPAANKQMGMVMRLLPIIFTVISISFPSGLVLYFVISNLWRFGQQELIFRRHGSAHHPSAKERRDAERTARAGGVSRPTAETSRPTATAPIHRGPSPCRPPRRRRPRPSPSTTTTVRWRHHRPRRPSAPPRSARVGCAGSSSCRHRAEANGGGEGQQHQRRHGPVHDEPGQERRGATTQATTATAAQQEEAKALTPDGMGGDDREDGRRGVGRRARSARGRRGRGRVRGAPGAQVGVPGPQGRPHPGPGAPGLAGEAGR